MHSGYPNHFMPKLRYLHSVYQGLIGPWYIKNYQLWLHIYSKMISLCITAKILPVMKNQHLLLCTLIIVNALAAEDLHAICLYSSCNLVLFWCLVFCVLMTGFWNLQVRPIFLDAIVPAWAAILISITLILAFGEVSILWGSLNSNLLVKNRLNFPL